MSHHIMDYGEYVSPYTNLHMGLLQSFFQVLNQVGTLLIIA